MQQFLEGDLVTWVDNGANHDRFTGYVAAFIPKGEAIPDFFIKGQLHPKGIRIRKRQWVARRDDRYLVDCGMVTLGTDERGRLVRDVCYRLVATWNTTLSKVEEP
jgi:hypothetical protein